jgi:hypothetical protein
MGVEEEREVLQEAAELSGELTQRTTSEAPQRRYVLHRTGRSQEDDQLLREGRGWLCAPGRQNWFEPARTGRVGENASSATDDGDGSPPSSSTTWSARWNGIHC